MGSVSSNVIIDKEEWKLPKNKELTIIDAKLCKRKLWLVNHWAVLTRLSDNTWLTIQYDKFGGILIDHTYDFDTAKYRTRTFNLSIPKISSYGSPPKKITIKELEEQLNKWQNDWSYYILIFHDCQNFAREVIKWLTNNWVGIYPIEEDEEEKEEGEGEETEDKKSFYT